MRVLYAEAVYGEDEISAALNVLKNQPHSLMTSENVLKLESKVSDLFGHTYGIMVNSGSSANLLALQSLELPEKSEVITPALTFATTLAPIVQSNLVPVFIDCKKNTFNIDTELIEAQITPRTRALMIPNLIGNVANLPEIKKIAEKNNLIVIEDSADTIGHTINNEKTGNFSDISTTSFYASHIITGAGFGGMVVTSNDNYRKNSQLLRGWGRDSSIIGETENIDTRTSVFLEDIRYDAKFIFSKLGYNFLPSEISAAFALVQAGKLQLITDDIFWESFKRILIRLKNTHDVIYISPNNCCGYSIIGGVPVPNVMEITWVKKSLLAGKKFSKIDTLHPSKMQGNYSNRAQLDITGFFPEWKL